MQVQANERPAAEPGSVDLLDSMLEVVRHLRLIVGGGLMAGVLTLGATYLIKPTFTSSTVILPPQQQQSMATSALSSLGALAGLAGGAGGVRSPIDQYVALLQSTTVADRMIERFKLKAVYEEELQVDARKRFWGSLRVTAGRRDGLLTVEVDDHDPKLAAAMAAAMVDEFRRIAADIAVTEAQQRRVFFEKHLAETRDRLAKAQLALQGAGFTPGALKAEPKAAAEGYARLKAETTAAQVRLQGMLGSMTAQAPEVQQQQAVVGALKAQLQRAESSADVEAGGDYVGRYREFKYQETLFELFSRQFEIAKVDEGREGGLIQVVDAAQVPEKKSKPRRGIAAITASVVAGLLLLIFVVMRQRLVLQSSPQELERWSALGRALRGRR